MSGGNISYEIDSGGGEDKYFDKIKLNEKNSSYAHIIAGEIVDEILETALDIATTASETDIDWREIKESRSKLSANSSVGSTAEFKNTKIEDSHLEKICTNIVGSIVENIKGSTSAQISDVFNNLSNIRMSDASDFNKRTVAPLDVEMKSLLQEMLSPPYQIVQYDCVPVIGGIGDQTKSDKTQIEIGEDEVVSEVIQITNPVEKKSRVTDLLKNSPRLISEYLLTDLQNIQTREELEESEEKVLNVIELNSVTPEELFGESKKCLPVTEQKQGEDDKIITMPKVDIMDMVDLSHKAFKDEEIQLISENEDSNGAKGDEPIRRKNIIIVHNESLLEEVPDTCLNNSQLILTPDEKTKKKKRTLGSRIWRFFKRGNKHEVK